MLGDIEPTKPRRQRRGANYAALLRGRPREGKGQQWGWVSRATSVLTNRIQSFVASVRSGRIGLTSSMCPTESRRSLSATVYIVDLQELPL